MNIKYLFFHNINPVFFSIGSIKIYWYGVMYVISFLFTLYISKCIAYRTKILKKKEIDSLFNIGFIGLLIGGRLGHVIFYDNDYFYKNYWSILKIWEGGMSFHGALIGIIISLFYFSKKYNKKFFAITDFIAPLAPYGIANGRIGNFINGELWGKVTNHTPFAVLFPQSHNADLIFIKSHPIFQNIMNKWHSLPRHPSQLYEFFFEGIILLLILNLLKKIKTPYGFISSCFLIFYGIFRIIMEYFRDPDYIIYFNSLEITAGQMLSLPMIILGFCILIKIFCLKNKK
ncbi:Phosphatidylglycerol--prolipoprotein diacylglyceryl transferase [Buchnera aphidicola (Thelaxes suberi)]|uniref:prolipoprotein diacylglyceryl transferase n=1 Tax=Buchnera aphidicola TaxID=9 RepID=UPI003464D677